MKYANSIFILLMLSLGPTLSVDAIAETCALPHTISNGQVADATKVMDNFNAVADCAGQAVTTTGTPTTGSVAVISGENTVSSGNLTGDVTTSGGTATTLSSSGVTPGIYPNATITVDAKGRVTAASTGNGNSDGGNWWYAPPAASSFTLLSGDETNLTLTDDNDEGLLIDGGTPSSSSVIRAAYKTLTSPSGDWDLKVKMPSIIPIDNYSGVGLFLQDSLSGRCVTYTLESNGPIQINTWNSLKSYSYTPSNVGIPVGVTWQWFRIQHSAGKYNFMISPNGKGWTNFYSQDELGFLTNRADRVGILVYYNRSGLFHNIANIHYFSLSGPGV